MLEADRALSSTTVFSGRAIRKLINFNETTDRRFYSLAALHFFAHARAHTLFRRADRIQSYPVAIPREMELYPRAFAYLARPRPLLTSFRGSRGPVLHHLGIPGIPGWEAGGKIAHARSIV